MKLIKNLDGHDFEVPYEGNTYFIPQDKEVFIDEDLLSFLQERWPMSFDFNVKGDSKKAYAHAKKEKTPVVLPKAPPTNDMVVGSRRPVPTFGGADLTPPSGTTDSDGVSWYGEGISIE